MPEEQVFEQLVENTRRVFRVVSLLGEFGHR